MCMCYLGFTRKTRHLFGTSRCMYLYGLQHHVHALFCRETSLLDTDIIVHSWDVDPNKNEGLFDSKTGGTMSPAKFKDIWNSLRRDWDQKYAINFYQSGQGYGSLRQQETTEDTDQQADDERDPHLEDFESLAQLEAVVTNRPPEDTAAVTTTRANDSRNHDSSDDEVENDVHNEAQGEQQQDTHVEELADGSDFYNFCNGNAALYYLYVCLKKHGMMESFASRSNVSASSAAMATTPTPDTQTSSDSDSRTRAKRRRTRSLEDDASVLKTLFEQPLRFENSDKRDYTEIDKAEVERKRAEARLFVNQTNESVLAQLRGLREQRKMNIDEGLPTGDLDAAIALYMKKVIEFGSS